MTGEVLRHLHLLAVTEESVLTEAAMIAVGDGGGGVAAELIQHHDLVGPAHRIKTRAERAIAVETGDAYREFFHRGPRADHAHSCLKRPRPYHAIFPRRAARACRPCAPGVVPARRSPRRAAWPRAPLQAHAAPGLPRRRAPPPRRSRPGKAAAVYRARPARGWRPARSARAALPPAHRESPRYARRSPSTRPRQAGRARRAGNRRAARGLRGAACRSTPRAAPAAARRRRSPAAPAPRPRRAAADRNPWPAPAVRPPPPAARPRPLNLGGRACRRPRRRPPARCRCRSPRRADDRAARPLVCLPRSARRSCGTCGYRA